MASPSRFDDTLPAGQSRERLSSGTLSPWTATQRKPPGKTPPSRLEAVRQAPHEEAATQPGGRPIGLASPRPPWQSPTVITSVSVGIVAVVLIIIVVINQVGGNGNTAGVTPISANVASVLLNPSPSVISDRRNRQRRPAR